MVQAATKNNLIEVTALLKVGVPIEYQREVREHMCCWQIRHAVLRAGFGT